MRAMTMTMTMTMAAAAAMLVAGDAAAADAAPRVETIRYETSACFGTCPVYAVTVSSDGRGTFEGKRFTAVAGTRAFRVSAAQWREFRRRLLPLYGRGRVDMTEAGACQIVVTDQPGVEVRWSGGFRPFVLRMNYGCDRARYGWMMTHLRQAPEALPIAGFVKGDAAGSR